ncbi:MAG: hypothetical protein H0T20_04185 [Actinobacteria bacterium]|nr:hypothetical protein [Actinomycetota bacterium]
MTNRLATWLNLVFASIIVIGVFVQAYLIASYAMGAGESALDAHGFIGGLVIHASELLVFLTAIVAFWRMWRWIAVNFGLFVLGTVQIFLLPPDDDPGSPWVHGLHGLFALFVLVYAASIAKRDLRLLRMHPMATAPPPG